MQHDSQKLTITSRDKMRDFTKPKHSAAYFTTSSFNEVRYKYNPKSSMSTRKGLHTASTGTAKRHKLRFILEENQLFS